MTFIKSNSWVHLTSRLVLGTLLLAGSPLFAAPIDDGTGDDSARGARPVDQVAQLSPRGAQGGAKALAARFPTTHDLDFTSEGLPALREETTAIDGLSEPKASHTTSNGEEVRIQLKEGLPKNFILQLTGKPSSFRSSASFFTVSVDADKSANQMFCLKKGEMSQVALVFSGLEPQNTLTFSPFRNLYSVWGEGGHNTRELGLDLERIRILDLGEDSPMAERLPLLNLLVNSQRESASFGELVCNWEESDNVLLRLLYDFSSFSLRDGRYIAPEENPNLQQYSPRAVNEFRAIFKPKLEKLAESPAMEKGIKGVLLEKLRSFPAGTSPNGVLRELLETLKPWLRLG